jgi:hypothetical protein
MFFIQEAVVDIPSQLETHEEDGHLYLVLTDTKKFISSIIKNVTDQAFNHISLSFDPSIKTCWSFNMAKNGPIIEELIEWPQNTHFSLYKIEVSPDEMRRAKEFIDNIFKNKTNFKFGFTKMVAGFFFKLELEQQNALFCSEFIELVLVEIGFPNNKDTKPIFMTPYDVIRLRKNAKFVKRGKLHNYIR